MIIEKVIGNIEAIVAGRVWLVQQSHPCFVRCTPTFVSVAGNAGANHVVPGVFSPQPTWNDVVQGKLLSLAAAILTGVLVTMEHFGPAQLLLVSGAINHIDEADY
jgi:hypothetical protein